MELLIARTDNEKNLERIMLRRNNNVPTNLSQITVQSKSN